MSRVTAWTDDGRPAAWESTTEPEWDTRERSLMLALDYYEAGLCRRCGHHLDEAMDPLHNQDDPTTGRGWVAEGPDECFACKALHKAETKYAKDEPDVAPYVTWHATLRDKTPRLRWK